MGVTSTVSTKFTAIDKFSAKVSKMSRATQTFAAKAEVGVARANRAFRSMTSPLRSLSRQLGQLGLVLGITAVISVIGGAINVFKDFEQANANLSAVMSSATAPQLATLQADAERLGGTTAKTATEVVGLQESFARLGFPMADIINMTEATISGSIAMRGELADTAELVGAVVKTFDTFGSIDAPNIIDKMTLATQKSALNFEKLQKALPIVGGAANAAGISFESTVGLLGKLSDAGIDASSSATALRNIFIDSKAKGHGYEQILENIQKNQDKLTASNDAFGKKTAVSASILANKLQEAKKLTKDLSNETLFMGAAQKAAEKQQATLGGALTLLSSGYDGFILSLENGNGAFSTTLKNITQVATDMLSMASGTDVASKATTEHEKKVAKYAEIALTLSKIILLIVGGMIAFKIILLVTSVLMAAYNIGLGIMGALSGTASIAIGGNAIALGAYKIALGISTAAQWLFNAAMSANPIVLTIIAILALIAIIAIVVTYWDDWGAAVSFMLGPIGLVISIIQSLRRNWDMIGDAFTNGGFLSGILAIGKALLDAVLMPIQQILEIASKIPGSMGEFAAAGAEQINTFRYEMGVNTGTVADPKGAERDALTQTINKSNSTRNELLIKDQTGRAELSGDAENNIGIFLPSNMGFQS